MLFSFIYKILLIQFLIHLCDKIKSHIGFFQNVFHLPNSLIDFHDNIFFIKTIFSHIFISLCSCFKRLASSIRFVSYQLSETYISLFLNLIIKYHSVSFFIISPLLIHITCLLNSRHFTTSLMIFPF